MLLFIYIVVMLSRLAQNETCGGALVLSFESAHHKQALCEALAPYRPDALDPHTRDLVTTAKALNDVNRRVRNLLAANVCARLEALGSTAPAYNASSALSR